MSIVRPTGPDSTNPSQESAQQPQQNPAIPGASPGVTYIDSPEDFQKAQEAEEKAKHPTQVEPAVTPQHIPAVLPVTPAVVAEPAAAQKSGRRD